MTLVLIYAFTLPLAFLAARWGWHQLTRAEPPVDAMRSMQSGAPITHPQEKLAECRRHGIGALVAATAFVVGPALAHWN